MFATKISFFILYENRSNIFIAPVLDIIFARFFVFGVVSLTMGNSGFPVGYGLAGNMKLLGQLFLGHPLFLPQFYNIFPYCIFHGDTSQNHFIMGLYDGFILPDFGSGVTQASVAPLLYKAFLYPGKFYFRCSSYFSIRSS